MGATGDRPPGPTDDRLTTISTSRLHLEPWSEAVRHDWIALNADTEVSQWLGTGKAIPRDHSEYEHELMVAQWKDHGFGWRSVIDRISGEWIGAAGLNFIGDNPSGLPPNEVEFGWWLKPSHWGRGLATEAAVAVRDEAFKRGITERLWARHTSRNAGSGRVMEKIGMHFVRDAPGLGGVTMRIFELERLDWERFTTSAPASSSSSP